jgi:hypothetical protein
MKRKEKYKRQIKKRKKREKKIYFILKFWSKKPN